MIDLETARAITVELLTEAQKATKQEHLGRRITVLVLVNGQGKFASAVLLIEVGSLRVDGGKAELASVAAMLNAGMEPEEVSPYEVEESLLALLEHPHGRHAFILRGLDTGEPEEVNELGEVYAGLTGCGPDGPVTARLWSAPEA